MALGGLPDEIITQVLLHLPPEDNLAAFQLTSRRMCFIARDPHLWRRHCLTRFRYWSDEYDLDNKLTARVSATNWMALFVKRLRLNSHASLIFEQIIESTSTGHQNKIFGLLAGMGSDVKDYLLQQANVGDDCDNVLSRRYYGHAVLASLHRAAAIEEWSKLQHIYASRKLPPPTPDSTVSFDEPGVSLERLVSAFDSFILGAYGFEADSISDMLDALTLAFTEHEPDLAAMSARQRALALNIWLRSRSLVGITDPHERYYNLRNCFVGQALINPDHESQPIISCVIYACIAIRIGLDAACCLFPTHVHVVVSSPPGRSLDGNTAASATAVDMMYLDPYGADTEVLVRDLHKRLALYSIPPSPQYFCPAPPSLVARRITTNIIALQPRYSHRDEHHTDALQLTLPADPHPHHRHHHPHYRRPSDHVAQTTTRQTRGYLDAAYYAAVWAHITTAIPGHLDVEEWNRDTEAMITLMDNYYNHDVWLIQKYLVPLHRHHASLGPLSHGPNYSGRRLSRPLMPHCSFPSSLPRATYHQDNVSAPPAIKYRVGQVVRHTRFLWTSIVLNLYPRVLGFAPAENKIVIETRSGYHGDKWCVWQDCLELVSDSSLVPAGLRIMGGRYFDRFDEGTCMFVCRAATAN